MKELRDFGAALQILIHHDIPLSPQMGFSVVSATAEKTRARMLLEPNTNHLGTMFGGSLFAGGALTCFVATLAILRQERWETKQIVAVKGDIQWLKPGTGNCEITVKVDAANRARLVSELRAQSRSHLSLEAEAWVNAEVIARVRLNYSVRL